MKVTPEIRINLEKEVETSQTAIDKAQQRLASWSGSARQIEVITQVINQHWPRIVFINTLLDRTTITTQDLEIISQGTLTIVELRGVKNIS